MSTGRQFFRSLVVAVVALAAVTPLLAQVDPLARRTPAPIVAGTAALSDAGLLGAAKGAGNVIADPSFEAGTPNSFWTESSTNFGTPICDFDNCGDGGNTAGPFTGVWWAWFGGYDGVGLEESSASQAVVFGPGVTELTFWLRAACSSSAGASHFLEVLIDGTRVFLVDADSPLCGAGYTQQTVDVSAFAGGLHTVEFHGVFTGPAVTNFSVDEVKNLSVAVFADGFESGDTSAWSSSVGQQ